MECNRLKGYLDLSQADGRVTPCCLFDITTGWNSNIYTGVDFSEWSNPVKKGCWPCVENEYNGHESMRQTAVAEGIQIALDFTCNFMCRICRPALSSKWDSVDEDWTRFDKDHFYKDPNRKRFANEQERFLNLVDLSEMKEVQIVGGEPFLSKKLVPFLKKLPKSAKVYINTNASIFPDDATIKELEKFDSVQIDASIDAVGELAECIRFGTIWSEVEKNINRHISLWDTYIYTTISVLNVNKLNEVYDFAGGDEYHGGKSRMNPLITPTFLRLEQIPQNIRKSWGIKSLRGMGDFNNIICNETEVKPEHKKCIDFIQTCDKHQGILFQNVNKEMWEILWTLAYPK
jgi:hypothetical protein